jgi:iron complex outermembrane receptor protein
MRVFRTAPVFSLGLLAAGLQQAQAQQNDIYELITTAIHVKKSETALPVTVLTGDSLHSAVRATLGDTLAGQPGISNASFGPAVGQTVIRGQAGRRVMNLSNNLPNADASGNSADHAQTVEAILAEAVEVLRGPSTLLYGGGAIGGVVNVVDRRIATRLPQQPALALETRHDTAGDMNSVVASSDFATGQLAWHVDVLQREWNELDIPGFAIDPAWRTEHEEHADHEHDEDDDSNTRGYIANSGGKTESFTVGSTWFFDSGRLGLAVQRLDNRYGLPPGFHGHAHDHDHDGPAHDDHDEHAADGHDDHNHDHDLDSHGSDFVYIDMQRTRYDLQGEWRQLAPWAETVDYRLSHTSYAHAEVEGNGAVGTRFRNDSWQHRLQVTHTDTAERHGVIGLQYSTEEFAAIGAEAFVPVTAIDASGLFVVEDFHRGDFTFELGGRLNRDDYAPRHATAPGRSFDTWSFAGSSLWDFHEQATLGLSVARSQRAPSVEELYSNVGLEDLDHCVIHHATGACELGNSRFKAETSLNTDLTLSLEQGLLNATLTLFHNRFNDYIGQINSGLEVDGLPVREYRQDDANFTGLELDLNLQLAESLNLRLFGDTIRGRFENLGAVPRMPPTRYGAELQYSTGRWSASASLLHGREQNESGMGELPTQSWTRLDLGADYRLATDAHGELLLFVKGRNLGNDEIRLSSSFLRGFAPEAGRSVETGLRYRF